MRLTNKWSTLSLAILRFALPAQVVKLVDTLASGASARKGVEVQVLSWAPLKKPVHASFLCTDNAGASDGLSRLRARGTCMIPLAALRLHHKTSLADR